MGSSQLRRIEIIRQPDAGHRAETWAHRRARWLFLLRLGFEIGHAMPHLPQQRLRLL